MTLEMVVPNYSILDDIDYCVILFSYNEIPDATAHLRNLQQLVASKPRRTLTILNRLDDVKQKLEKD